ncbi:MAG: zeta toxin family protein [Rhodanobacteraceae bacterium]
MALTIQEEKIRERALAFARENKKAISARLTDLAIYLPEDCPVSVFMAGSPGAGKTEASKELIEAVGGALLRIDPDELRDEFDGYTGSNAWLFQPAVSVLVERILDVAFKQKQSFLLDGTLTNHEKARQNIKRSLGKKRVVQILYVYQEPRQAWAFVQDREALEGRRIDPETFIQQYFEARKVVNCLKKEFGKAIEVDLLLKNIDGSDRFAKANVDQIDNHIPEKYDSQALRQFLYSLRADTP